MLVFIDRLQGSYSRCQSSSVQTYMPAISLDHPGIDSLLVGLAGNDPYKIPV